MSSQVAALKPEWHRHKWSGLAAWSADATTTYREDIRQKPCMYVPRRHTQDRTSTGADARLYEL